ncbi:VWA domain-containing protein [Rhodobacter sp. KR11]|nr:VWA domain-containing protein [Rhodobacter sp. KR11]MCW1920641.1 VWA domain-containing protein [Rhodobacter sp. KR11]
MEFADLTAPEDGRLAANITHFARALRKAGFKLGPGRVLEAIRAVQATPFTGRADFFWVLHACLVTKREERVIFEQVFRLYWRDPRYLDHMMSLMLPQVKGSHDDRKAAPGEKRAAQSLLDLAPKPETPPGAEEYEIDASATASAAERLRRLDFEQMSVEEMAEARRMLSRLTIPVQPLISRRLGPGGGARIDRVATLRAALRQGDLMRLHHAKPRERWPNLVALCDISGSMSSYSRMVLHFLHAVMNAKGQGWARVHGFTFGTRLTNITRHLAARDVDVALAAAGAEAQDWQGGTRIGACLHQFNQDWGRRVLGQGAVVLLITDGLDRDPPEVLSREMARLHLSCRRLIWVNPLLRWDGFLPKAQGIRAMLPHCDAFRAGHSIASLQALALAVAQPHDQGERNRLLAHLRDGGNRAD